VTTAIGVHYERAEGTSRRMNPREHRCRIEDQPEPHGGANSGHWESVRPRGLRIYNRKGPSTSDEWMNHTQESGKTVQPRGGGREERSLAPRKGESNKGEPGREKKTSSCGSDTVHEC